MIRRGQAGSYGWIQVRDLEQPLGRLIASLHVGKRLAIVAFDSGPLRPDPAEQKGGWVVVGPSAVSPPLDATIDIPEAGYDEWYVLDRIPDLGWNPEIFVNYMNFTLVPPEQLVREQDPTWDRRGWDWLEPLQEKFWQQLDRFNPVTYVASSDRVIIVSRSRDVLDSVARAAQQGVATDGASPRR
jgi:hypothetical protein